MAAATAAAHVFHLCAGGRGREGRRARGRKVEAAAASDVSGGGYVEANERTNDRTIGEETATVRRPRVRLSSVPGRKNC